MTHTVKMIVALLVVGLVGMPAWAVPSFDDAEGTPYDDGFDVGDNGGVGYLGWVELENTGGADRFLASGGGELSGTRSFGMFAGDGGIAMGRPLDMTVTQGTASVLARHNVNNEAAFTGFNLKSSTGGLFGTDELVAFGLVPGDNSLVSAFGGDGTKTLNPTADGELRGDLLEYLLDFNTTAGTYMLTVNNLTESVSDMASGTLKDTAAVAMIAAGHFNSGISQDLIYDDVTVTPEPATLAVLLAGGLLIRHRRRAT